MATEFSMLAIMNAALLAQGQHDITEGDGSDEWRLLFRNWPLIVEAELEDGRYNFTKEQRTLLSRIDGKFGFTDGYLVPGDALHVRRVWVTDGQGDRYLLDWISDGSYVYVDHPGASYSDGVHVETTIAADEHVWSATFARGVQMKLESLIAKAVKEEFGESQNLDQQAEMYFQRARTASSKQRTAQPAYRKGPLAQSRASRWRG